MTSVVLLERLDTAQVGARDVELRAELLCAFRRRVQSLLCLGRRLVRFVHLVEGNPEHEHVEEYDLCEIVHAFVEG